MNDEEIVQTEEPVIEIPSEGATQPDPAAPPILVVPLEDVLEYFTQDAAEPEDSVEASDGEVDLPVVEPDPVVGLVESVVGHLLDMIVDLGKIEEHTREIEKDTNEIQLDVMRIAQTVDHPALTTSFADYTVSEALLLFLLLAAFLSACARMLRGGFSWLRS